MAYTPMTDTLNVHQARATNPTETASQLKVLFDTDVNTLKTRLNGLITELNTAPTPIAPTLLNGWVNYGGTYKVVGYYKDGFGNVHIEGGAKSGTTTDFTDIFTLPAGYRPSDNIHFPVYTFTSTSSTAYIRIGSTGAVEIINATSTLLSLDGISFRAEA